MQSRPVSFPLSSQSANEVAEEINAAGGRAFAFKCDVSDRNVVYAVAQETLAKTGGVVDILVNNAGIVAGKKLLEADDARSDLTIKVNTTALLWVTKAFLPGMMARKRGHVDWARFRLILLLLRALLPVLHGALR